MKATRILGWKPRWNIDTTIEKTIDWYRCYVDEGKNAAFKMMKMQIEEYEDGYK